MNHQIRPLSAGLYFVATPIGAARDITLRGLDILASVDVIAAEDTRTVRKLMDIHGVPLNGRKVIAFHDHSGDAGVAGVLALIKGGKSVACVSEAGTPLVADPGFELGRAAAQAGIDVIAAPGPSAVLAALSVSGLPTDRFAFVGFLAATKQQRRTEIAELRDMPFTLVLYESPKRLNDLLTDLVDTLGEDRHIAVCRELTKKFEEVQRGPVSAVRDHFESNPPKGEIVVLIDRPRDRAVAADDIETALREAMKTMRVKDAATTVAGALGLPRRQVYQTALAMGDDE